jgi:hypothetical protein
MALRLKVNFRIAVSFPLEMEAAWTTETLSYPNIYGVTTQKTST